MGEYVPKNGRHIGFLLVIKSQNSKFSKSLHSYLRNVIQGRYMPNYKFLACLRIYQFFIFSFDFYFSPYISLKINSFVFNVFRAFSLKCEHSKI